MSDKVFDSYLAELNKIITDLNQIAGNVEPNAKGLNANKCADSINWVSGCLKNIGSALKDAYDEDLAEKNN